MLRTVTTRLDLAIDGRTNMVFSIAAARDSYFGKESLSFVLDGVPLKATELVDDHGTRLHQLISDAGTMVVEYSAEVVGLKGIEVGATMDAFQKTVPIMAQLEGVKNKQFFFEFYVALQFGKKYT